jgi:hypothetical protein
MKARREALVVQERIFSERPINGKLKAALKEAGTATHA